MLLIEDGNRKVGHCVLLIGDYKLMVSDIFDGIGSTRQHGPFIFGMHLYVENSDAVCEKALAAGAKLLRPLDTKFYGDCFCARQDPFGHIWHISTHIKDVPPEELKKLADEQGRRLKEIK